MLAWFKELDEVLRGKMADPDRLAEGTSHIHVGPLVGVSIALGVIYGLAMGLFAVLTREPACFAQLVASAAKVPALFFFTLVVTFPSLYVFSALLGVKMGPKDTLRLIAAPLAVNLAVLASFAPITAFFTLNTTSYPFMKLLNVFFFAVAGFIGLGVLLNLLRRVEAAQAPAFEEPEAPRVDVPEEGGAPSADAQAKAADAARRYGRWVDQRRERDRAQWTFRIWLILYALVGAQMGWILRPFIGSPELPFEIFRPRHTNIFVDVLHSLSELLGG